MPKKTIDTALEGLGDDDEDKKESEQEKPDKTPAEVPSGLVAKAQEILGTYLKSNFSASKSLQIFLKTLGPFVLQALPAGDSNNHRIHWSLAESIDEDTWIECIKTISDGYLTTTDIAQINGVIDLRGEEAKEYIPEIAVVEQVICTSQYIGNSISPYLIVMGMEPRHRPLVAVAIRKAIDYNELTVDRTGISDDNRKERLLSTIPSLKHIAETAKEYQVSDLKEIIADLNEAVRKYKNNW